MADFCNICANEMWGCEVHEDIDVPKIFRKLEPGYWQPVLCEGCELEGVAKDDNGELLLMFPKETKIGNINDYQINKNKRIKISDLCQK